MRGVCLILLWLIYNHANDIIKNLSVKFDNIKIKDVVSTIFFFDKFRHMIWIICTNFDGIAIINND